MRTVHGPTDHVVVVGAGLSGLAAALHLLGAGRRVTIIERADHPGGRAGQLDLSTQAGTYAVDTGPTVLTMPELLDEAFAAVGDSLAARLDLVRLDPAYRALFADGSTIDVHTDAEAMEAEVRRVCGATAAAGYLRLREWLGKLYRAEIAAFIGANVDNPLGLLGVDLLRLARLGGFGRLGPRIERLLPDPRLRRIFSFQALYAGVPPDRALALYGVISYMDTIGGVYFPRGGMRRIGQALADAAVDGGATLWLRREVTGLEQRGGRVSAVRHTGPGDATTERLACDAVVLTPDLPVSYRLLGRVPARPVPIRWSPSAVVLHAGVRGPRPDLAHHTISFGRAWAQTFREIAGPGGAGRLMSDPSVLITRATATDPALAPPGRDLLLVLAPCPNLDRAPLDWASIGPAYRDELLAELERRSTAGPAGLAGLTAGIEVSRLVTPIDWAAQGMAAGTPFSAAHTLTQTGPFRPRNLPRRRSNVVLAGCGTVPGVGIPPVLISGRLAAERITGVRSARGSKPEVRHDMGA